jgi:hypothetical protein
MLRELAQLHDLHSGTQDLNGSIVREPYGNREGAGAAPCPNPMWALLRIRTGIMLLV